MDTANIKKVESPSEAFPGYILVSKDLTAAELMTWFEFRYEAEHQSKNGQKPEPWEFPLFRERFCLIREWHIDGLGPEHLTGDPLDMPSMRLVTLVVEATQSLIIEARSLPNLLGPLNVTSNTEEEE